MRLSSLANLLSGQLSAPQYSAEIAGELAEHTRSLQEPGGVAPVRVTEDANVLLDRTGLQLLCRLFAAGHLTAEELAYTADALQLAERVEFSDEGIARDLAECTDQEVNGPLDASRALEIASAGTAA